MKDYKYEKLKQILIEKIQDYSWPAGSKILSERELASRYDVSRITARKAVEDLIADEYLEHIPGKRGTFVKHQTNESEISNLVGVAIDHSLGLYQQSLLLGIEDCLWKYKKHTVYCNTYQDLLRVEEYFDSLVSKSMDGIVFSPVVTEDYRNKNSHYLQQMEKNSIPYVLVDRYIPGIDSSYVITNNRDSSYRLTETILNRGHENILLLSGIQCSSMADRVAGFEECLKDRGMNLPRENRLTVNDMFIDPRNKDERVRFMKKQLEDLKDFTAVVSLNTPLLMLADEAIGLMGINRTIEAACYDAEKSSFTHVDQIARVVQPSYQMGYESAKTLMELKSSSSKITIQKVIPSELETYI